MKNKLRKTRCVTYTLVGIALILFGSPSLAQEYAIDWYTIDGGGGVSSGGQYVLAGTIGQPDAAYSAGGSYELLGGFWPGGPLCFVDFYSFARFAEYWLVKGTGLPADLYEDKDNIVNWLDLEIFVAEWLYTCPYNWQLK
ncbi:MAG: hypothetical protein ACYS6W_01495 [Planctomycetota bacterium]